MLSGKAIIRKMIFPRGTFFFLLISEILSSSLTSKGNFNFENSVGLKGVAGMHLCFRLCLLFLSGHSGYQMGQDKRVDY